MPLPFTIDIEEYFKYHPPTTQERQDAHKAINEAALSFAKVVDANVQDEITKQYSIFAIQQARMFANQGVTVDELINNMNNN
jgi:hypothetical protein